jgi:hypothetical protein
VESDDLLSCRKISTLKRDKLQQLPLHTQLSACGGDPINDHLISHPKARWAIRDECDRNIFIQLTRFGHSNFPNEAEVNDTQAAHHPQRTALFPDNTLPYFLSPINKFKELFLVQNLYTQLLCFIKLISWISPYHHIISIF